MKSAAKVGRPAEIDAAGDPDGPLVLRCDFPADVDGREIAEAIGSRDLSQVFVFASPEADFPSLVSELTGGLAGVPVVACTTAGELTRAGYAEGRVQVVGLAAGQFAARHILIEDLTRLDAGALWDRVIQARLALAADAPDLPHGFAMLVIDGLSRREDDVVAALAPALGPLPLFGGSAADGRSFARTAIAFDGVAMAEAAVLTLIASRAPVRVFSIDNLSPGDTRMVVTAADPERRLVTELNGAPAAPEYARLTGVDVDALDPRVFAAHPVAVRVGGQHHVRAIQRVGPDGSLVFFSAIDAGMVLSVAETAPMAAHLDRALSNLSGTGPAPEAILACDCILRRIEAESTQATEAVSEVLRRHNVTGFSTYGEQIGPIHVNQTMTGVAIFPPDDREDDL